MAERCQSDGRTIGKSPPPDLLGADDPNQRTIGRLEEQFAVFPETAGDALEPVASAADREGLPGEKIACPDPVEHGGKVRRFLRKMPQESADDLAEEIPAARLASDQFVERGGDRTEFGGQLLVPEIHVQPDPDNGVGLGCENGLDEDAGELATLVEEVVRPLRLEPVSGSEDGLDGRADDPGGEVGESRPEVSVPIEGKGQGKEQIASGSRLPTVSAASPSPGLEIGRNQVVGTGISGTGEGEEIVVRGSGFLEVAEAVDGKAGEVLPGPTPDDFGVEIFVNSLVIARHFKWASENNIFAMAALQTSKGGRSSALEFPTFPESRKRVLN